jgi:hypothetical protein
MSKDITSHSIICAFISFALLFLLSIALTAAGGSIYKANVKHNSKLSGVCANRFEEVTKSNCPITCFYWVGEINAYKNASFVDDCNKSYKLDISVDPHVLEVVKPTSGYLAMLVVGSVLLCLSVLIMLSCYICCQICGDKALFQFSK